MGGEKHQPMGSWEGAACCRGREYPVRELSGECNLGERAAADLASARRQMQIELLAGQAHRGRRLLGVSR